MEEQQIGQIRTGLSQWANVKILPGPKILFYSTYMGERKREIWVGFDFDVSTRICRLQVYSKYLLAGKHHHKSSVMGSLLHLVWCHVITNVGLKPPLSMYGVDVFAGSQRLESSFRGFKLWIAWHLCTSLWCLCVYTSAHYPRAANVGFLKIPSVKVTHSGEAPFCYTLYKTETLHHSALHSQALYFF